LDKRLLEILCCPQSRAGLRQARREEIDAVNRAIAAGSVRNASGEILKSALSDALVTVDGLTIYRIEDDIPVMLVNDAISTRQLNDFPR